MVNGDQVLLAAVADHKRVYQARLWQFPDLRWRLQPAEHPAPAASVPFRTARSLSFSWRLKEHRRITRLPLQPLLTSSPA
jgi:hypothetical protein